MTPEFLIKHGVHLFRGPAGEDKQGRMMLAMMEHMGKDTKALILDYKAVWDDSPPGMAVLQCPDPDTIPEILRMLQEGVLVAIDGPQFFKFDKPHYELPVGATTRVMGEALKVAKERGIKVFATWTDGLEEERG